MNGARLNILANQYEAGNNTQDFVEQNAITGQSEVDGVNGEAELPENQQNSAMVLPLNTNITQDPNVRALANILANQHEDGNTTQDFVEQNAITGQSEVDEVNGEAELPENQQNSAMVLPLNTNITQYPNVWARANILANQYEDGNNTQDFVEQNAITGQSEFDEVNGEAELPENHQNSTTVLPLNTNITQDPEVWARANNIG